MTGALHTSTSIGGWLIDQIAKDLARDYPEPSPEISPEYWQALAEQELNK